MVEAITGAEVSGGAASLLTEPGFSFAQDGDHEWKFEVCEPAQIGEGVITCTVNAHGDRGITEHGVLYKPC